jgi:hypothetical protein
MSKFDTQIHVEENSDYEPTEADLAELNEWIDEIDDYQQPEDDQLLQIMEEQELLIDEARDAAYYDVNGHEFPF